MKLVKLFQKNAEQSTERVGKNRQARDDSKAARPRKVESGKKKVSKKADEAGVNWVERLRQYLREVLSELRKVVWPSRKETIGSTAVVLVLVIIAGFFLGIVDAVLSRLVHLLVG